MPGFFSLEPEVAGGWGRGTDVDTSVHPPVVRKLHYVFQGWLGDDLVASFPCYLVSEVLGRAIGEAGLDGAHEASVEVSPAPEFDELQPEIKLPAFLWLKVTGVAGQSDFGVSGENVLVVSKRALDVMRGHNIDHCIVAAWP